MIVCTDANAGPTPPTGWTEEFDSSLNAVTIQLFHKIADGTETDIDLGSTGQEVVAFWLRVSGAGAVDLYGLSSNSGTSHTISGITTTVANCLVIYGLAFDGADSATFNVTGTGFTQSDTGNSLNGGAGVGGTWGTKEQAVAGATGDATVTTTASDGSSSFQIAIAPA